MRSVTTLGQSGLALVTYTIDFKERPICHECRVPMNVHSYGKPSEKIGLHENYYIRFKYYICENSTCPNRKKGSVRAENRYIALRHAFDYEVEAKICEVHFKNLKNGGEIKSYLESNFDIGISESTIGEVIKRYEIASKLENMLIVIEEIKKYGGTLICVDVIHPKKGGRMLIVAKDFFTGRTIYCLKVRTQKRAVQKAFHEKLKQIMEENGIKVFGIMSDDHKSQRLAIKDVWGDKVPHCSCHFHFFKQIMAKPLGLHSKLVKNIRKALRKITWVENFRTGDLIMDKKRRISQYLERIIKDLFALTKWKTGRNNFRLDAVEYYERIGFYHRILSELIESIDKHQIMLNDQEKRILSGLVSKLEVLIEDYKAYYEELNSILVTIYKIEEILNKHGENGEEGIKALEKVLIVLKNRQKEKNTLGEHEAHLVKELEDFVSDRGQTLFNYRKVNSEFLKNNPELQEKINNANTEKERNDIIDNLFAPKTNNDLELKFKMLRYFLKRILGQHNASRYLLAHGEYILHVDMDASFEKIKKTLMNADYIAISKEIKKNTKSKLTRFKIIKDIKSFESVKQEYAELLAIILAEYI